MESFFEDISAYFAPRTPADDAVDKVCDSFQLLKHPWSFDFQAALHVKTIHTRCSTNLHVRAPHNVSTINLLASTRCEAHDDDLVLHKGCTM